MKFGMRLASAGLFFLLTSVSGFCQANQGVRYDNVALLDTGRPAGSASIHVCSAGSSGTPCAPAASIFTDQNLSVTIASGIITADAHGNYGFYASCGQYDIQISGSGLTTATFKNVQIGPCGNFRANFSRLTFGTGTLMTAGKIALAAAWGSTATVTQIAGTDAAFRFVVTPNGTGIASNPGITVTFSDGTWGGFLPICQITNYNPSGVTPGWVFGGTTSSTQLVIGTNAQAAFTPVAATGIGLMITCVGSPN